MAECQNEVMNLFRDFPFQTRLTCTSFIQQGLLCSFRLNTEFAVYYLRTQNNTHKQFTPRSSSHFRLLLCFQSNFKSRCFNPEGIRMAIIKFLTLWSKRETREGNQTLVSPAPQTLVFLLQRSRSQPWRSRKDWRWDEEAFLLCSAYFWRAGQFWQSFVILSQYGNK